MKDAYSLPGMGQYMPKLTERPTQNGRLRSACAQTQSKVVSQAAVKNTNFWLTVDSDQSGQNSLHCVKKVILLVLSYSSSHMSCAMRKPVFGVSDQV